MAGSWTLDKNRHWKLTGGEPVTFFQALGIHKGRIAWPQFTAQLPTQVQQSTSAKGGATGGNAGLPSGGSAAQNAALGKEMAAQQPYNWTGAQWDALNNIAMSESGWVTDISNGGARGYQGPNVAYGIPQALPGSKMASAGADWQTNPRTQIAWMLGYIRSTYGTPVNAWNFHLAHGWY